MGLIRLEIKEWSVNKIDTLIKMVYTTPPKILYQKQFALPFLLIPDLEDENVHAIHFFQFLLIWCLRINSSHWIQMCNIPYHHSGKTAYEYMSIQQYKKADPICAGHNAFTLGMDSAMHRMQKLSRLSDFEKLKCWGKEDHSPDYFKQCSCSEKEELLGAQIGFLENCEGVTRRLQGGYDAFLWSSDNFRKYFGHRVI